MRVTSGTRQREGKIHMVNRVATWAIVIWTGLMAVGIVAAALGIGGDCTLLTGTQLNTCQNDAWIRGGIGLTLLFLLWLVLFLPMAMVWLMSRPRENIVVFGPTGQAMAVSETEARKRVEQQGWSYQGPAPGGAVTS